MTADIPALIVLAKDHAEQMRQRALYGITATQAEQLQAEAALAAVTEALEKLLEGR